MNSELVTDDTSWCLFIVLNGESSYHSPFVIKGTPSSGKTKVIVSPMTAKFRIVSQRKINEFENWLFP